MSTAGNKNVRAHCTAGLHVCQTASGHTSSRPSRTPQLDGRCDAPESEHRQPEAEYNSDPPPARELRGRHYQSADPVGGDRDPPTSTSTSKLPATAATATSGSLPDGLADDTTRTLRKRSASDAFLPSAAVMVVRSTTSISTGTGSGATRSDSPTAPAAQPEAATTDHSHWWFAGGCLAASLSGTNRPSCLQWQSGVTAATNTSGRSPQQLTPSTSSGPATTIGLSSPPAEQPSALDAATAGPTALPEPTLAGSHRDELEGSAPLRQPEGTTAAEPPAVVASQAAGRNKRSATASASHVQAGGKGHHAAPAAAEADAIQVQVGDAAEEAPGALPTVPSPTALPVSSSAAAPVAPAAEADVEAAKGGGPLHSREAASLVPHGLWRISAGPLSFLPAVGSLVVYCTDGHLQQMQAGGAAVAVAGAAAAPADRRVRSFWRREPLMVRHKWRSSA